MHPNAGLWTWRCPNGDRSEWIAAGERKWEAGLRQECDMRPKSIAVLGFLIKSAEGGIRTHTPCGATPSRWCVCQFRHFRNGEVNRFQSSNLALDGQAPALNHLRRHHIIQHCKVVAHAAAHHKQMP